MNIFTYIKKYGTKTFKEQEFNEIDNVILSCLAYVNFEKLVSKNYKNKKRLELVAEEYFKKNSKKQNKKNISEIRNGIKLLYTIKNTTRYKDIYLLNYSYVGYDNTQFSALSFELAKNLIYVAFEGTDHLISGWEEDMKMAYKFPVQAQRLAVNYLNKHFALSTTKLIVGGHSKGGNLALISAMYSISFVRKRIIKIYSNDGLGLRKEQINSLNYQEIKTRVISLIPDYSVVGLMLYNDKNYKVVKSTSKGFFAHNPANWEINENAFTESTLSRFSIVFNESFTKWLDSYTDEEKANFVKSIFDICRENNFTSLNELKKKKIIILKLVTASKNINQESKDMLKELIKMLRKCNKEYDAF